MNTQTIRQGDVVSVFTDTDEYSIGPVERIRFAGALISSVSGPFTQRDIGIRVNGTWYSIDEINTEPLN